MKSHDTDPALSVIFDYNTIQPTDQMIGFHKKKQRINSLTKLSKPSLPHTHVNADYLADYLYIVLNKKLQWAASTEDLLLSGAQVTRV